MNDVRYDQIGHHYAQQRRADPRLLDALLELAGAPEHGPLADIGAGTLNYSCAAATRGFNVLAVEPSWRMHRQAQRCPGVQPLMGVAEALPLADNVAASVICVLAIHHFRNVGRAFAEMARVSRGPVILFTFDPRTVTQPWLADYFPSLWRASFNYFPPLGQVLATLARATGRRVYERIFPIPHDVQDGFAAAGWRRPELYLDPTVRAAMSGFALAEPDDVARGVTRLRQDLEDGNWQRRYGHLCALDAVDAGYRLLYTTAKR